MSLIKSKGSKIEKLLSHALWAKGYRFRKNVNDIFGKPDIAIKKYKLCIFVDSEFWHGKDWFSEKDKIKSNKEFWTKKIEQNIMRDKEVNRVLLANGWIVLRFWGIEIKKNLLNCVAKIEEEIRTKKNEGKI